CFHGWCLVGAHPVPRRRSPQKSPSGAAPEGQSRVNDQNPRVPNGATTTTTTERARVEARALWLRRFMTKRVGSADDPAMSSAQVWRRLWVCVQSAGSLWL